MEKCKSFIEIKSVWKMVNPLYRRTGVPSHERFWVLETCCCKGFDKDEHNSRSRPRKACTFDCCSDCSDDNDNSDDDCVAFSLFPVRLPDCRCSTLVWAFSSMYSDRDLYRRSEHSRFSCRRYSCSLIFYRCDCYSQCWIYFHFASRAPCNRPI